MDLDKTEATIQVCEVGVMVPMNQQEEYTAELCTLLDVENVKMLKTETYKYKPILYFEIRVDNLEKTAKVAESLHALNLEGVRKFVWERDASSMGLREGFKDEKTCRNYSLLDTRGYWTASAVFTGVKRPGMESWYLHCPNRCDSDIEDESSDAEDGVEDGVEDSD